MKLKSHKLGIFLTTVMVFAVAAFASFLSLGAVQGRVFADDGLNRDESYVTIYDDGEKTIIKSTRVTVREVLESAKISIDEKSDIVEPGLDEEITSRDFFINIYRARPALVIDGSRTLKLMTASTIPRDVAIAAGVNLYPEDVVKITTDNNFLATGIPFSYLVVRARLIRFNYYGTPIEARTQSATIGDFLDERDVSPTSDDWLSLPRNTPITDGMDLALHRNGKSTVVLEESIPQGERETHDYSREIGYRHVDDPGRPGKKAVTYEIEMFEGREISRTQISEIVTEEPVTALVTIGKKAKTPATTPTENENISWRFLRAQGFSRNQTAGIMGNLMQEHGFKTSDAAGGCGIVQWTASRRAGLMAKPNWESIHVQLGYLMEELNGKYLGVKNSILASSTVEEAVRIFQNQYERCGRCNEPRRIQYAHEILWRHEE